MGRRGLWRIGFGALLLVLVATQSSAAPQADRVQFTVAGDFGTSDRTSAVLDTMHASGSDLSIALGDLSYATGGQEQAWCDLVTSKVGAGYPFELLSGNHESNGENGNINDFSACLPNQLPGVVGSYGRQYYVDVPADRPLVRYVMISPGLPFADGVWNYDKGSPRYQWTSAAIDGARAASIPWVVVGMHKPCLSVGQYECEVGADIFNLLLGKRVDLILSGHEHTYQRTKQLALGTGCPAVVPGTYTASCVVDSDDSLVAGRGTVALVVGTGGQGLYDINQADTETSFFATRSGANANPTYGALNLTATGTSLQASFLRSTGGTLTDAFTVTRSTTPVNEPPVAAFVPTCTDLSCAFDASTSTDPEGPVAGYAWDFGDGTSGTGVKPTHAYAAAGSYPVTLTVTDGGGATATAKQTVSPKAPVVAPPVARDDFGRTVTSGFGTADVGGAWSNTGTTSDFSVANGFGSVRLAAGGGPTATLGSVSAAGTDAVLTYKVDKLAAGSGVHTRLVGRKTAAGGYFAKARVTSTGAVLLELDRSVTGGSDVVISSETTATGLSYAPGDLLSVRTQVTGASPTTVRSRVWKAGTTEPTTWLRSVTDATAGIQTSGSVGLGAYLSSSATNAPVTVSFDSLVVTSP
ncbi:MAG: hypothetical protein JWP61_1602 [Friedmanniella sp.]|nr:hypothetical protein [Friedmanniella sp.]